MSSDFYKKPIFYFILIPIIAALWPVSLALVYLPNVDKKTDNEREIYQDAEAHMQEILKLHPTRLDLAEQNKNAQKFDYMAAFVQAAKENQIPTSQYSYGDRGRVKKTQKGNIKINDISIKTFADFLDSLQKRWADLECDSITLTAVKGITERWTVNMRFVYYY